MAGTGVADTAKDIKRHIHGRIRSSLSELTGPSFEERVGAAAKEFRRKAAATEREQNNVIQQAKDRAKLRPSSSAVRSKEQIPPTPEERAREHQMVIRENTRRYAKEKAEREHRMRTREPLYKVSEVKAAFEACKARQKEHQRMLAEEEKQRWAHIEELKQRVVHRPLLVEDYARPEHGRTVENPRLIPEHTKPTPLQQSITRAVSQPWFHDTAWGKEVGAIRERQDQRPKLHEIQYPPKKFEYKPRPKEVNPMDARIESVVQQRWYQKSQWAEQVREIRQRQDDRPKLHEISYPPKGG